MLTEQEILDTCKEAISVDAKRYNRYKYFTSNGFRCMETHIFEFDDSNQLINYEIKFSMAERKLKDMIIKYKALISQCPNTTYNLINKNSEHRIYIYNDAKNHFVSNLSSNIDTLKTIISNYENSLRDAFETSIVEIESDKKLLCFP
jgi:hypothetical protein